MKCLAGITRDSEGKYRMWIGGAYQPITKEEAEKLSQRITDILLVAGGNPIKP